MPATNGQNADGSGTWWTAELVNTTALAMDVARMHRGGGSVKMRVVPENLGELTIHVDKLRGEKLNVRFEATSQEAREAISSSLPELRQILATSRHEVGTLEVERAGGMHTVPAAWTGNDSSNLGSFLGGGSQQQHGRGDERQGGSAWQRYEAEQEARQNQQQYRQQGGNKRYQEQLGA